MVKNEQKRPFLTFALALAIDTLPIGVRGVEGAFLAIYSRTYSTRNRVHPRNVRNGSGNQPIRYWSPLHMILSSLG